MPLERQMRAKLAPADVVARCRDLAKELIDEARRGFASDDDPQTVSRKSRWNDLRPEFTSLVSQSERDLGDWVAKRTLSAEAAETLLEARNLLQYSLGFPGVVDPNKRALVEPLERFRKLTRRKPRRKRATPEPRQLTAIQFEVVKTVAECGGNLAEAARRLGRDRKTIEQSHAAALAKLAKVGIPKAKTEQLMTDRRGQVDVGRGDRARRGRTPGDAGAS